MTKSFFKLIPAFLFALIMWATPSVNAQVQLGLVSSYDINMGSINDEAVAISLMYSADKISIKDYTDGLAYGVGMYGSFGKLFLRTEAKYSSSATAMEVHTYQRSEGGNRTNVESFEDRKHYLNVPVTAGLALNKVQLGAGMVFNFIIASDKGLESRSGFTYTDRSLRTDGQLFAGYKLNRNIHLNVRYQHALGSIKNEINYEHMPIRYKGSRSALSFGVAYFL